MPSRFSIIEECYITIYYREINTASKHLPVILSSYAVSSQQAEEKAVEFLRQHHSVIKVEKSVLKEGVWAVEVLVSSHGQRFIVKVDAKTGLILGFLVS